MADAANKRGVMGLAADYAGFVKIGHTVFALPFAAVGVAVAYFVPARETLARLDSGTTLIPIYMQISWLRVALVFGCMVGARSFAMAVNRIIDRNIDALNPRTANRELPSGKFTNAEAWGFAIAMAGAYFILCGLLGRTVLILSPIPIALMTLYPYTKRFSAACHLVLGASLGLAPIGAWVAIRAGKPLFTVLPGSNLDLGWEAVTEVLPWILGGAVMLWVAGFDVIYALQDDEFDRANNLHSIPARFGRRGGLWISRVFHLFSAALFTVWAISLPDYRGPGVWILAAPAVMSLGMVYQHTLVKPDDLSRVNRAFFTVNGFVAIAFAVIFIGAVLLAA